MIAGALPGRLSASAGRAVRGLRQHLRTGSFARGVSVLFAATLLAQAASLAVSPILTRIYPPAQFGILALYTGLVTVLTAVATLRYDAALPIARSDPEAAELFALCAAALALTGAIVTAASLAWPAASLARLGLGALIPYRILVPIGFVCLGAFGVAVAAATRNAAYGIIARTRLTQAATGPVSQIGLGLLGFGAAGLIAGAVLGQCAGLFALLRHAFAGPRQPVSWAGMAAAARRYRAFPLVSSWAVLADMIGAALAVYLLAGMFYPPAVMGYLFLTDRVVGRPLGMITTSLAPVMLGSAGRDAHADPARLRRRFIRVALAGAAITGAWILAVNLAAPWLFPRLFGPGWAGAVPFIQAVSLWYLFAAVARLIGPILQVLEHQGLNAISQIGGPLLGAAGFVWCAQTGRAAAAAVLAFSAAQALGFLFTIAATAIAIERIQPPRPT